MRDEKPIGDRAAPPALLNRRTVLRAAGLGFGAVALGGAQGPRAVAHAIDVAPHLTSGSTGSMALGAANVFEALDPHVAVGDGTLAIHDQFLYEGLFRLDPLERESGEYQPQLAAGPLEQIDDRTYRATVRPDATFHNDDPVTADDVVFSFERLKDPNVAAFYAQFFEMLEDVRAIDDRTVEFRFSAPTALATSRVAMAKIMSRAYVETADERELALQPVGSGPYRVVSAVSNERIEMEAHRGYDGERQPTVSTIMSEVILDGNARTSALTSARVDAIESVPYASIGSLERADGVVTESVQGSAFCNIIFHCGKPPFDDKRVRQAFLYAIDRDTITDVVFFGQATSALSFLDEGHPYFHEPANVYHHDPDRARSLLRDAGVADGLEIELLISNEDFVLPQGEVIRQNLDDIGIRLDLKTGESLANFEYVAAGDYDCYLTQGDMSLYSWEPDIMFGIIYRGNWPRTGTYWQTAATDQIEELLTDAERSTSDDERRRLFVEVQEILADEVPQWPVHFRRLPTAWRESVDGLTPLPTPGFDLTGVTPAGG